MLFFEKCGIIYKIDVILYAFFCKRSVDDKMKMEGTFVGSVVLSGLSIVFIALLLLIFFVWLMDKVFSLINNAKKDNAPEDKKSLPEASAPPAVSAAVSDPAGTDGISDEVVAVISAAVAAMSSESGTVFKIKSIKRSGSSRRGAWGNASAAEGTRSFDIF